MLVNPGGAEPLERTVVEPSATAGGQHANGILSEIAASLSAEHDLEALLQRFLGAIVELCGASAGAARVLSDDGTRLQLVGSIGLPANVVAHEATVPLDCGVCGDAARGDRIAEASDVSVCAERSSCAYFGSDCTSVLAVPLSHRGRMLGIYNLFLGPNQRIGGETLSLLRSIGELLGLALENARLARASMRATLMTERHLLASEVHDSLAQTLYYMKMRMSLLAKAIAQHDEDGSLKYLGDVNDALTNAYTSLRELLMHFRSRMDPHGLLHALTETAHRYHEKTGVRLKFENHVPELSLPVEQELHVFHIVNEALANISRHSGARHAFLALARHNGYYEITIEDDGSGMTTLESSGTTHRSRETHYGISIMRERANRIGGDLHIEKRPRGGTRVRLRFPTMEAEKKAVE